MDVLNFPEGHEATGKGLFLLTMKKINRLGHWAFGLRINHDKRFELLGVH